MNGKKAKQLRRQAELESIGLPYQNMQGVVTRAKAKQGDVMRYEKRQVNCIRHNYQELKKQG